MQEQASTAVEEGLLKAKLESLYTFKILLLGAGESGKSTIVKQFRLIHNRKLSKQELETISDSLHQNVIDCIRALLQAAGKFGYQLDDDTDRYPPLSAPPSALLCTHLSHALARRQTAEAVAKYEENTRLSSKLGEMIGRLYKSEVSAVSAGARSHLQLTRVFMCTGHFQDVRAKGRVLDFGLVRLLLPAFGTLLRQRLCADRRRRAARTCTYSRPSAPSAPLCPASSFRAWPPARCERCELS